MRQRLPMTNPCYFGADKSEIRFRRASADTRRVLWTVRPQGPADNPQAAILTIRNVRMRNVNNVQVTSK